MIRPIIRRRQIHLYYCVLLLYVADDDGSDTKEELDNGKKNIMETGGKAYINVPYVLPKNYRYFLFVILNIII